jgi:hypothetical protein
LSGLAASAFLLDSLRNQAISLKCPAQAMLSEMAMFHQLRGSLVRSGLPTTQQQLVNERIALFAQMNTGRSHKMPMT